MVTMTIDRAQLAQLDAALQGTTRKLDREIKMAINATAKKTKTNISKEVRKELAAPAKAVNGVLSTRKATTGKGYARVTLKKESRLPLKAFSPRQTKKGVSYRISKSQGRKSIPGAFMGPRPGTKAAKLYGHVWERKGEAQFPIRKKYGVSPWGVFIKRNMKAPTKLESRKELRKQIQKRIRFITLKKQGVI